MKILNAMLLSDAYKQFHPDLYANDTEEIYSTWTARTTRISDIHYTICFGYKGFIQKYLVEYFGESFFSKPLELVLEEYAEVMNAYTGSPELNKERLTALHKLGYLPLEICAVPEGTKVAIRVPTLTIRNTKPEFYWLVNFIETLFSCEVWQPTTSATLAYSYKKILLKWAKLTCDSTDFVDWQGHDFSMRGMPGLEAAVISGAGHLTSFKGTDTIPALAYLKDYYAADLSSIGSSIPATEHSIMECNSAGSENDEYEAFKRIITEVHPEGAVSIVSDTWNLWKVLTDTVPRLKNTILSRDGKVVIRPDSGDPCDIICGINTKTFFDSYRGIDKPVRLMTEDDSPYYDSINKGVIELLWEVFGGTVNSKGYKVLDPHIGCIYGDAITRERAEEICSRLESKGFASSNIVFGIGSFTYTYNTRDTFGFAIKTTYGVRSGKELLLFKDPITDNGVKKSQKGLVAVPSADSYLDGFTKASLAEWERYNYNLLQCVFRDGVCITGESVSTLDSIRSLINYQLEQDLKQEIPCAYSTSST